MEVEIDYLAIGKRIRTARLSKKMTQETLSNMIDVAPTYVSSIENGHTKLSLATLLGIAQSLDTTVDQLLYRIGSQAVRMEEICGCSRISAGIMDRIPQTRNWIQESFTPSAFGEK